ncbi:MAG: penicillin-binding protein 1C [Bacteroidetes bacterium]|nr:penicillin-binding protein 1C [Bacteroidota bacterium]
MIFSPLDKTKINSRLLHKILIIPTLAFVIFLIWLSLPRPLFNDPLTTVLLDHDGNLLGAKIAADQQWRFPESEEIPEKFQKAIINYEDRWFRFHPGFNPVASFRAARLNISRGRIVSGGSTITMQVVRLARKNRKRTIPEKIWETILAYRLELTHTKADILRLYASHAPFGGNVVGLEAASWRYFGVDAKNLSWAEAATLAVLPNSPGLIYPGRNPQRLLAKRNSLLETLYRHGVIDAVACELAKSERLPGKPYTLPQLAPHLLAHAVSDGRRGEKIVSSLDISLQRRVSDILGNLSPQLNANGIWNAAALVIEVNTGKTLAYVGNLPRTDSHDRGNDVDIVTAPRSTGSILKPFLYAAALNDGLLLPNTLVADIPTQIGGFAPENYNLTYDGAVPASRALARSLNIPAVKMLQTYGYEQFYSLLKKAGLTTLEKPAGHYGLALILGGAEATLWDIAGVYASMARNLNNYNAGKANDRSGFDSPHYLADDKKIKSIKTGKSALFDVGSTWLTFDAMLEVARPGEELLWRQFSSSHRIAWKTGTSFGNRDAWSVGVTPEYVVAVWVGNASGEGRPGLTGIGVAAPALFNIFRALPATTWFRMPAGAMMQVNVCRYSGYRASSICEFSDSVWIPKSGAKTAPCPFHQLIHLDKTGQWQVTSACESPENMLHVPWFVLPPVQEWYFRNKNPFYKVLPPFRQGCDAGNERRNMEIIYPKHNSILYIPVDLDGKPGSAVFRAAHRDVTLTVYWYLDDNYIGSTRQIHQMALSPDCGIHRLTLTDQNGERITIVFEVVSEKKE